ncbi:MAG: ROK family transcriptional regulator [Actinomycetota bacterium]|nr:ROK family transcriptional regulator [Actinomycetota bacterium]
MTVTTRNAATPATKDRLDGREAASSGRGAGPQLMRAMNERLVLEVIRSEQPVSRAHLARLSGLSKPTVGVAVSALKRDGLVRAAGMRTGMRGRAAELYEIRPEAGFVLGLDVGREYLRGAIADITGDVRARGAHRVRAARVERRVAELVALADELAEEAGIRRSRLAQVVIGSPGVFDPERGLVIPARNLPGWGRSDVLHTLKEALGRSIVVENDVSLAALAERDLGHGRGVGTFCFVSVGTGIGMGLVIDGRLHRGFHGAAGEISYLPIGALGPESSAARVRRHGALESAAAAAAVVRAARRAGVPGAGSSRSVFAAAQAGDAAARAVVDAEVQLVAKAAASVVAVIDPELLVLGGGVGRAPGFAAAVAGALEEMLPFAPEVLTSALGDDAVTDGCLAMGNELAWRRLLGRR